MRRETGWVFAAAVSAAGCVVIEKGSGEGASEGVVSVSGAPGTDSAGSTSAATDGATAAPTGGASADPVFPPGHEEECLEDTAAGYDFSEWQDLPVFDPAGLEAIACPAQDPPLECSATPIAGLQGALIIRNDKLPAPKPYLAPMYRWIVVSNAPLGCDDPLGAPLCEGQWRIAWPMDPDEYCFSVLVAEYGASTFLYGGETPVLIDRGDADCQTHAGSIGPGLASGAQLHFPKQGQGLPIVAQQCLRCEIPGVPVAALGGQFIPQICP